MAKGPKRQPDAARKAKLTIQRRTLYLLMVFGVVSFLALFAKAYDLTINRHEEMQERASNQQTQSTTISASRGTIYDRNGETLAISATAEKPITARGETFWAGRTAALTLARRRARISDWLSRRRT